MVKHLPAGYEGVDRISGQTVAMKLRKPPQLSLRQGPCNCSTTFTKVLKHIGFTPLPTDPCVYTYGSGKSY